MKGKEWTKGEESAIYLVKRKRMLSKVHNADVVITDGHMAPIKQSPRRLPCYCTLLSSPLSACLFPVRLLLCHVPGSAASEPHSGDLQSLCIMQNRPGSAACETPAYEMDFSSATKEQIIRPQRKSSGNTGGLGNKNSTALRPWKLIHTPAYGA